MYKKDKIDLAKKLIDLSNQKKCVVIVKHEKIKFANIDNARRKAKEGTIIKKIKNNIAKKAFNDSNFDEITKPIKGENIFIFSDDIFDACSSAETLTKEADNVSIFKAAFDKSKDLDMQTINELIKLGSKKSLQSKLLNVISEVAKKTIRVIQCKVEMKS